MNPSQLISTKWAIKALLFSICLGCTNLSWAATDLASKAAEFSQLSEKIRNHNYKGGRDEQVLQVQSALAKPVKNVPAGATPLEVEEEHSTD